MKRIHALLIALAVAVAAIAGTFAATRSTQLGATPRVSDAAIASQNRALDRAEAALRKQAAQKPPALPALPNAAAPAGPAVRPVRAQTVIYRRPPAIVKVVHRHGGEREEAEQGRDSEGGGEGLDD